MLLASSGKWLKNSSNDGGAFWGSFLFFRFLKGTNKLPVCQLTLAFQVNLTTLSKIQLHFLLKSPKIEGNPTRGFHFLVFST